MVPDEKQAELASAHAGFDPWRALTAEPRAVGLGQAGAGLRTSVNLELAAARAGGRDAVHRPWPVDAFGAALEADGVEVVQAATRVAHRHEYLRRPTSAALSPDSEAHLTALGARAAAARRGASS
ncbi:MAG: ethanolamine ammonia-lyase light chain EutC [Myxococcota bacterium]